jgi:hypothetical protein
LRTSRDRFSGMHGAVLESSQSLTEVKTSTFIARRMNLPLVAQCMSDEVFTCLTKRSPT